MAWPQPVTVISSHFAVPVLAQTELRGGNSVSFIQMSMLHQISIFLKIIALRYFIKYVQVDGTGMKWFCSLKKTAGKYFHFVLQAGGSNSWTMISQVAAEPILESISLIRSLGWCHRKDHNVKTKPWNWCFYQMRELKPKGKHQLHLIDKDKKGNQEKVQ